MSKIVGRNLFIFQSFLALVCIALLASLYLNWYGILSQIIEWQQVFHKLLGNHVTAINEDPFNHGLSLIMLSFGYGVFHAVGPGHGKAVIITYLGSNKESLKRGAVISLLAALLQAIIAILLVVILAQLLSIRFSEVNSYADNITSVSYLLVMGLGLFLAITALFRIRKHLKSSTEKHDHSHLPIHDHDHSHEQSHSDSKDHAHTTHMHAHHQDDHNHSHEHSHEHNHEHSCCGHKHAHESEPEETWLESLGVIFSMGMRPCAGAIVVLIYAHLVGAFFYGIIATLVMGLGTGLAIASIALGTQLARNWFESIAEKSKHSSTIHAGPWIRMAGGVLIFFLGLSLFQATLQASANHPLI